MMDGKKNRRMIEISMVIKMSKIALSVIVLIFSTSIACASVNNAAANETAIESLIQDLADQNVSIKVNAVKTLVEMGEPAVEPLIQAAVGNANTGDTVIVYLGTYTENMDVNKGLTIISKSGNPSDTIVQAG